MSYEVKKRHRRTAGLGFQDLNEASERDQQIQNSGSRRYYSNTEASEISLLQQGPERTDVIGHFKVEPIGPDSLLASWSWKKEDHLKKNVALTRIYYFPQNSKMQVSNDLTKNVGRKYTLRRNPSDTQYRVCIRVQKGGDMESLPDDIVCRDSTSQPWHMPASIGSSVGALLALIVVILVMVSLQRKRRHRRRLNGGGPSSKRSRIDSALESQFDSIAFREETSFYDDATTIYDSTCGASAAGDSSCLHSSCGANSVILASLSAEQQQLDNGTPGVGATTDHDGTTTGASLEPAPMLGRQVSTSGTGKSVTFKEEGKIRTLQRHDSEDSRDVEPASVVMETVIDTGPKLANSGDAADGKESSSGIYTQLIETI